MKHFFGGEMNAIATNHIEIGNHRLYQGDCLEVMKSMEDKSIDLCLTDPPYGIDEANGKNDSRGDKLIKPTIFKKKSWDKKIPDKIFFDEIRRISKHQIIFGGNYFIEYLTNSSCWLVWDKNNTGDFADCELAWTNFKTAVRKYKFTWNGMLQENMKNKEKRFHPTQKPINLMEQILKDYSEPGQTIFDPMMGSGTTIVACENLNRIGIGIELDKEYFNIAKNRIEKAADQLSF